MFDKSSSILSSSRSILGQKTRPVLRVALAVAGDLLLESVQDSLRGCPGIDSRAFPSFSELLAGLEGNLVDAVILDDLLEQTIWIGSLVETLKKASPTTSILVIGSFADGALIYELLQAGIRGYLYRGDELRPLFEPSLRSACAGKPYFSPTASSEYAVAMQSGRCQQWYLDKDAKIVLRMLASGMSVNEIAGGA